MTDKYFRHIDGGLYRFLSYARCADTDTELVVYEHLWPFEPGLWVRSRRDFETRFAPTDEIAVKRAMKQDRAEARERVNAAKTLRRATTAAE